MKTRSHLKIYVIIAIICHLWTQMKKHLEVSWEDITSEEMKMVPNSPMVDSKLNKDRRSLFQTLGIIFCNKEIQPSEGDQPWDYFGRNDAKAETPVLWLPHAKSWFTGKDCDAGRDWGQEEKGTTEDEMAGWHHWLDGCESGWTPGVGDGQGGLACCDSWGRKESDTTERLNWTELNMQKRLEFWTCT